MKKENKHSPKEPALSKKVRTTSDKKQTEKLLFIKDIALQSLLHAVALVDLDGKITFANKACIKLWGYTDEKELLGRDISELSSSGDLLDRAVVMLNQGNVYVTEDDSIKKDGVPFVFQISANLITSPDGKPLCMIACFVDITEKKRLEEAVKQSRENLELLVKERTAELEKSFKQIRNLASHLQIIREEERTTISREIHDEIGHLLTSLKLELEDLMNQAGEITKFIKNKVTPLINLVDDIFDSVRVISAKLRPEVLDSFGLIPAMKWQIQQSQLRDKSKCEFETKDLPLNNTESITIFRIFQEILTNILRHSEATKVYISFKSENNQIILKVIDNGIGFDLTKMEEINSFGLIGMRERAVSIGAKLTIESVLSVGTTVTLLLSKNLTEF